MLCTLFLGVLATLAGHLAPAHAAPAATPPVTSGLELWFEAGTESYANGGSVTRWTDKSGNGRDLTAANSGAAPAYRSGAVNGRAAIEFNGSTSLMKTYGSTFSLAQPTTFFIVYKSLDQDTSARAFVFDSRNSSIRQVIGRPGQGQVRLYANADLDIGGITYPFADYSIWSGTYNGTSSAVYRNGTLLGSGYAGGSALDGFTVGGLNTAGTGGFDFSHSLVAEVLYYSGALSAGDRNAVTDWLNEKYAAVGSATAPANTSAPTISGQAQQGSTLTATSGSWSGTAPIGYEYQWRRCDAGGASCADITGATSASYTAAAPDVGSTLRVNVKASNSVGSATAPSAATSVVAAGSSAGSPPVTAGLQLWFDANAESYADGAAVTRWRDLSGFGRDLTADNTVAPTYRTGAVNGRAALEFDGSKSLMKTYGSTFTIGQPTTFFVVYKSLDGATSGQEANLFDSRDTSNRQLFGLGSFGGTQLYANTALQARTTYPFSEYELWSGTFDGPNSSAWRDDALVASGYAGFGGLGTGLTLGGLNTGGTGGAALSHSLVAEVLYYSGSLSSSDRETVTSWLNTKYKLLDPPAPPANTVKPSITGAAKDGTKLTASPGTWTGSSPISYAYQWRRCNSSGASCTNITGATASTYTAAAADVGSTLLVTVTATNSVGSSSTPSDATAVVTAAAPSNTAAPSISGPARDGQSLTATTGTWSGTTPITYGYQWQRCSGAGTSCAPISGATGAQYALVAADVGATVRVVVTATNSIGSASASSDVSNVVAAASSAAQPPVTTGLQLWFDASQESAANGAAVTRWTDRSAFGRDLTSADTGSAATYRTASINGRAALEFDGTRSLMKTYGSTFTLTQPSSFFIVYKSLDSAVTAGTAAFVLDSRDSSERQLFGLSPFGSSEMYANADLQANATYPFPQYEVWGGTYDGASSSLWRNGSLVSSGYAGFGSLATGLTVGGMNTASTQGYYLSHSLVAEILYYTGPMSSSDRSAITSWLNQKYALNQP